MAEIKMPQLGETVTEGTVTKWLKKVGDPIAQDEILFEVSTDKVDSEVPSSAAGVITEILVQEGDTVDVGTVLAVIGDASSGTVPAAAPVVESAPVAPPVAEIPTPEPQVEPEPALPPWREIPVPVEAVTEPAPQAAEPEAASAVDGPDVEVQGLLLSPVVRRLIKENNLDPRVLQGSGAGGRITRSDVLNFLDVHGATPPAAPSHEAPATPPQEAPVAPATPTVQPASQPTTAPAPAPSTPAPQVAATVAVGARDEVVPFTNIRRRTAEHMVRSKATSAHALVAIEVDFEAVDRVRHLLKEQFKQAEGFSLTYLPFIARATVEALRTFPRINSSVGDDALIVHHDIHLSIAVDLDHDGLIAPVIHDADQKRLVGLARQIRDLAERARGKKLTADDIAGGTFTITNPGPYGTMLTVPIINQPQVAILATDGVKRKPVVVALPDGSESIAIHSVGNLALSFDHRVIDGAYAAAFLARMKEIVETWNWVQEF